MQLSQTIALTHHEHWDGSGYPSGLSGEQIPLAGRICAICDVFDALLSARPYKHPWPFERAVAEIERLCAARSSTRGWSRRSCRSPRDLHREWFPAEQRRPRGAGARAAARRA